MYTVGSYIKVKASGSYDRNQYGQIVKVTHFGIDKVIMPTTRYTVRTNGLTKILKLEQIERVLTPLESFKYLFGLEL